MMGKGMVRRERAQLEEAEALFERALQLTIEEGDPETASWMRSNQAGCGRCAATSRAASPWRGATAS